MYIFSNDIILKGDIGKKYQELKAMYGFELIDIYMISGVLGFMSHKKGVPTDGPVTATIPRNTLTSRSEKIDFLYQVVTLNEEIEADTENAMKLAFQVNSVENPKTYKKDLFDDYAYGGINILYDMLSNIPYDNQVDNIKEILDKYTVGNDSQKTADDIFAAEGL